MHDMVRERLIADGYDGLVCGRFGCACKVADLFPCLDEGAGCEAGYMRTCATCDERDDCTDDAREGGWCMMPGKRPEGGK